MKIIYNTFILDSNGNNVTGNFKGTQTIPNSPENNKSEYKKYKTNPLNIVQDTLKNQMFPAYTIDSSSEYNDAVFGSPVACFDFYNYKAYGQFTIDGIAPRNKDGKRLYMAPQGIVVDDETGDYYISFNMGSVPDSVQHGGPQQIQIAGVPNEYVNILPIIKFNNKGEPQGIEYVIGGNHEGFMTIFTDKAGYKRLGVQAFPRGVGTRNNDKKPDGFDKSWESYYYIGDDIATYYSFTLSGMFTDNNRNGNQLLHSNEYGGIGKVMDKEFDTLSFEGYELPNNSDFRIDPYNKTINVTRDYNNTFKYQDDGKIIPVEYINVYNLKQQSSNNRQSSCIRGSRLYSTFGGQNRNGMKRPEIRASLIMNSKALLDNSQSLIGYKQFKDDEIPDFWETEGCWVNKEETSLWFIIKSYYADDNQQTHITVYRVDLSL